MRGAGAKEPTDGGPAIEAMSAGIGLAWHGRQTCAYEQIIDHVGGTDGYGASILLLPQRGVGIIAMTNVPEAGWDAINGGALRILNQSGALGARATAPTPSRPAHERCVVR